MRRAQTLMVFFLFGVVACSLGVPTASADYNLPYRPPDNARPPNVPKPIPGTPKDPCDSEVLGSIISCQSQTLGEALTVTGTPFQLRYGSDRTPGRKDMYTLDITLSGARLPMAVWCKVGRSPRCALGMCMGRYTDTLRRPNKALGLLQALRWILQV